MSQWYRERWQRMGRKRRWRFERQMVRANLLDRMYRAERSIERVIVRRKIDYQKRNVEIKGRGKDGARLKITIEFSDDDGASWQKSLVKPIGNRVYLVRLTIEQLQIYPLLHGFRTTWKKPSAGWKWNDHLGWRMTDEAVGNPAIITRSVLSPITINSASFQIKVIAGYL